MFIAHDFLTLYLVTDRASCRYHDLEAIVDQAVQGGVTAVQFRDKYLSDEDFLQLGQRIKALLIDRQVPLIINDRVEVAVALNADGVHIGQSDMAYVKARTLLGPDKIVGLTVENLDQILLANEWDLDYVGASSVFDTPTKLDVPNPMGIEGLSNIVQSSKHPVCAIGGITTSSVPAIKKTGICGVAVASAICGAKDPKTVSQTFRRIWSDD